MRSLKKIRMNLYRRTPQDRKNRSMAYCKAESNYSFGIGLQHRENNQRRREEESVRHTLAISAVLDNGKFMIDERTFLPPTNIVIVLEESRSFMREATSARPLAIRYHKIE